MSRVEVGGANISNCQLYRYHLWRNLGPEPGRCVFVMLNPSTADWAQDDPTIRKCMKFASTWGYGRLDVVNLFAWRSTDPKALVAAHDPVGPENNRFILGVTAGADMVVCAWGARGDLFQRGAFVAKMLADRAHALKLNKDGSPMHPLYIRGDTKPFRWVAF